MYEHEHVPIVLHTLSGLTHYFDLEKVGSSIPILQMRTLRLEEVINLPTVMWLSWGLEFGLPDFSNHMLFLV